MINYPNNKKVISQNEKIDLNPYSQKRNLFLTQIEGWILNMPSPCLVNFMKIAI